MDLEIMDTIKNTNFGSIFDSAEERAEINQEAVELARTVLNSPSYISDPVAYIQFWIEVRGGTEEFRIPEDELLSIFKQAHGL
jgi:hypothetical protein